MRKLILVVGQLVLAWSFAFCAMTANATDHEVNLYSYTAPTFADAYANCIAYLGYYSGGDPTWKIDSCTLGAGTYGPAWIGKEEWDSAYWGHTIGYGVNYWPIGYYINNPNKRPQGGNCSNGPTGKACTGEPIEVGTGNMYSHEADFVSADPRLQFARSYNSNSTVTGGVGNGWLGSANAHIVDIQASLQYTGGTDSSSIYSTPDDACAQGWAELVQRDSSFAGTTATYAVTNGVPVCRVTNSAGFLLTLLPVLSNNSALALSSYPPPTILFHIGYGVVRDDGTEYFFYCAQGVCFSDSNVSLQLSIDASGNYTLIDTDGTKELYDNKGVLQTRTWKDGYQQSFIHNADGTVQSITDNHGRSIVLVYDASGRLSTLSAPDGSTISYTYDASNRLVSVQNPTGARTYQYTNTTFPNALTAETDENNNTYTTWTYDASGRATSSASAGGVNTVSVAYNSDGSAAVTDALGTQRTYAFQNNSGVSSVVSISGPFCANCGFDKASSYDSNGYLSQSTDWNGNITGYTFSAGLLTQRIDAQGTSVQRTTDITWDPVLRNPLDSTLKDASGTVVAKTDLTYNARGQALTRTQTDPVTAAARTITFTYCEQADVTAGTCPVIGLLTSVDGARTDVTDVTSFTYYPTDDSTCATAPTICPHRMGDLWKVTNALGKVTQFLKYDGAGRLLSIQDANGVITNLTYNPRGWLTQRSVLAGSSPGIGDHITSYTYDAVGQATKITQPDNSYVTFAYDAASRLTDVTDNLGNTIHYTLDSAGNRTKADTKDPSGTLTHTLSAVYDNVGQLQQSLNAQNAATTYTYDANGNPNLATDALGRVTDRDVDPLNRLMRTLQDANGLQVFTSVAHDARDHVTQVTDPQGLNTQYQYDGLGNLTKLTSPDTGVATYTYDAAGNRITTTDARAVTETDTYDALNRLTGRTFGRGYSWLSYQYDTTQSICGTGENYPVGHLTQYTAYNQTAGGFTHTTYLCYDRFGNMVHKRAAPGGVNQDTRYVYDSANRVVQIVTPKSTTITYTRDAAGRIVKVAYRLSGQGTDTTLVSNVSYYPYGPVKAITYANGRTLTRSYDQDYVVSSVLDPTSGGLDYTFSRNAVGDLTQLQSAAGNNLFGYDTLDRLTGVNDAGTNALIAAYTYDGTGNRLSKQTASGTKLYTYPLNSHQLLNDGTASRTYDAIGNTIGLNGMTLVYERFNRSAILKSGTTVLQKYVYDGIGQRYAKGATLSTATYFGYDESGHLIGDYNNTLARLHEYIWMDDLPVGVLTGTTGTLSYIEPDHLGTPRAVIDPVRNVAIWKWPLANDVFGESAPQQDPDGDGTQFVLNLRMPGQYFDAESGLSYNYMRNYDPGTGRYVESDPIGLRGGISTYGYVGGSPLNSFDPRGLESPRAACGGGPGTSAWAHCADPPPPPPRCKGQGSSLFGFSMGALVAMAVTEIAMGGPENPFADGAVYAEGTADTAAAEAEGDVAASTPTGQSGSPMDVTPGTNAPGSVGDLNYSGHAFDEMQSDGIMPSVVQNTVENGASVAGKVPGTTAYYDATNNITVITNSTTGRVITVSRGLIGQ